MFVIGVQSYRSGYDPDEDYTQYDEDYEKPRKEYSDNEKDVFIYGLPGDEDYGVERSAEDLIKLEKMWELDYEVQKWRGAIQGWNRGFYKDYDWELQEECINRTTVKQIYHIYDAINNFDTTRITNVLELAYVIYYTVDYKCNIEQNLHDLSCHCFNHNCEGEQLLQNEMKKVFQVTGALNKLAAIYYDDRPTDDQHEGWFDMYSEIGMAIGKLWRYTLAFDPKEDHDC